MTRIFWLKDLQLARVRPFFREPCFIELAVGHDALIVALPEIIRDQGVRR